MRFFDAITDFIFVEDKPQKSDIIFIAGCAWPDAPELAAKLYVDGFAPLVLPSGKYSINDGFFIGGKSKNDIYNGNYITEFDYMKDILLKNKVKENDILKENMAEYTYQNALFSKRVLYDNKINIKNAILCCKTYHSRRCLMYYQLAFPEVKFTVCPAITDENITKDNWFESELGISHVMEELERCGTQFKDLIR